MGLVSIIFIGGCLDETTLTDGNTNARALAEGLDFVDGNFTPTGPSTPLEKLIEGYNAATDKVKYFGSLSAEDQAILYQELPEDHKESVVSAFLWERGYLAGSDGSWTQWDGLPPAEKAAMKIKFNAFLNYLPPGQAGPLLNNRPDLIPWTGANLSKVDLTGWDPGIVTSGLALTYTDLSYAKVTPTQLNAAGELDYAKLRGVDLSGWDEPHIVLTGVDLRETRMTSTQLNKVFYYGSANLSGLNLSGLDLTPRLRPDGRTFRGDVSNVDFSNTNITADQLAQASDLEGVKLANTGITRPLLEAAIEAAGKKDNPPTGLDTVGFDE